MTKPEPLIKLGKVSVEVKKLTALTSLKFVLIHNKKLRRDKSNLQNRIDDLEADKIELKEKVKGLESKLAKCNSGKRSLRRENKSLKKIING